MLRDALVIEQPQVKTIAQEVGQRPANPASGAGNQYPLAAHLASGFRLTATAEAGNRQARPLQRLACRFDRDGVRVRIEGNMIEVVLRARF